MWLFCPASGLNAQARRANDTKINQGAAPVRRFYRRHCGGFCPPGGRRFGPKTWERRSSLELKEKQPSAQRQRLELYRQRFSKWFHHSTQVAWLGDFLYQVGFWSEYTLVRLVRGVRHGALALACKTSRLARKAGLGALHLLNHVRHEIAAPLVYLWNGARSVNQKMEQARKEGGSPAKVLVRAMRRGASRFGILSRGAMSYLLPLAAAGVFCFTVHTVLNYNYILAVEVNGQNVGYVASETVFDTAREDVQQRIDSVGAEEGKTWQVEPTFTLAIQGDVLDENQMVDAILQASSQDIQKGTALYVDGDLVAVTTDGDAVRQTLDDIKAPYEDESDPNHRVEFTKDVELVDGIFFTDSFTDADAVCQRITGLEQAQVDYTVQSGDTPWTIAAANGLTLSELYALNPQMSASSYNMYVGDTLVLGQERPFLEVKTIDRITYQVAIPFETNETTSEDYSYGTTKTVQEGVDGVKEITADVTTVGGIETHRDIIEETVLQEPVTKEVVKGTRLPNGSIAPSSGGSGTLMWPVPGYSRVSRWMYSGHKGSDICAPYGTPIYAADSGVVTAAGWNAAGRGYGYSIIINHGGMTTLYAHCSSVLVSSGQYVKQGELIGLVGSTGQSSGNHCHFEIRVGGTLVSARNYFPGF